MIKNIIFDMGGVVFDFNPRLFANRLDLSQEDRDLILDKVYLSYWWPLQDNGYFNDIDECFESMKKDIPERLWDAAYQAAKYWWKPGIVPIEGTKELLADLKAAGYHIYLLSNAGPNHSEYWHLVPGSEYFDGLFISAYEKKFKPATETFQACLKKFNLNADECVFLDDLATNCAGAYAAGIQPIIFKGAKDARTELAKLGVLSDK